MTDIENPFSVSPQFKEITPVLVHGLVETMAFIGVPIMGDCSEPVIVHACMEFSRRVTGLGMEDASYGTVWELSVLAHKLSTKGEVPFTPFDIATNCGDDGCDVDHGMQTRTVNDFFEASVSGDHSQAVAAYTRHVRRDPVEEWADSRVQYLAMLLVHVAERVSDFRSGNIDHMPSLDTPAPE
jgi:hypothetical protein